MKKPLLFIALITLAGLFAFTELGFPDLQPDHTPGASFATTYGNIVSCNTKALLFSSPISGNSAFNVGFYLSSDTTITPTDKLIATYSVASIAPGQTVTCVINNINLANLSVANGTYYIGTFIDKDYQISENGITPEIENNGWAFRNASEVFKVITYPAIDQGVDEISIMTHIRRTFDSEGNLQLIHKNNQPMVADIRSIDGRLIERQSGSNLSFGRQPIGIYLLVVNSEGVTNSEKVLWQ